ncbi:hypothetical protein PVK06_047295 [Gossypium arboreum]|uniref:Retrovirus-related Pol polyprotein from transposon TNT 1-94 n=1 Tax=Gossypium arboreum TaxID=29729 RepID=A0ABR0MDF2_GOSAR|nr:hypothetical protein PVK06_047295 [Gossypium arboreum]
MENYKPTSTLIAIGMKLSSQRDYEQVSESAYRSLVGCLLYLTTTRPDIMFAVSMLSRFMHYCNKQHFQAAKRVLRYIKGILSHGIQFGKTENLKLIGYTDSDWAGSKDDMKSTFVNQAIWLRKILADLNLHQREATEIYCDNKSAVAIAKNPVFHGKTKHFSIKLHVVREMEQAREIELIHCNSEEQIADIFTKAFNVSRFIKLRKQLGVNSMETKKEC